MNQHGRLGARLDQATVDIAALHPLLKLFLATRVVPPGPDLQQNRRSNQTHQVHTHFRVRRVRFVFFFELCSRVDASRTLLRAGEEKKRKQQAAALMRSGRLRTLTAQPATESATQATAKSDEESQRKAKCF